MSLSQKHSGKVLVPWFNIAEWKLVYNFIYSEANQDWPRALGILKIWKHRTPLLSAGVEGTLIVLEALLVNTNQLTSYEISHIFSTSLVRFLNLCAANNEKQGTFYKTAMKNELPKWLISIRHDIAHSHKVPSQSMLELSLKFCLEWLQGKYWDVQYDNMSDFIVGKLNVSIIEDAIYIYNHVSNGEVSWGNKKLMRRINKFLKNGKNQISSKQVLESVHVMLSEEIKSNKEQSADKICALTIDNLALLSMETEVTESGNKKIPETFLNKWNSLMNIIYESEIMPKFVSHLFNFICDESHDLLHREIGSLWIKEIFKAIINKEKNNKDKGLFFKSKNASMKNKTFCTEVLERLTPFTLNFLREVLQYNNAPSSFIDDSVSLISAFNTHNVYKSDKIFTPSDLNIEEENETSHSIDNENITNQSKSQWMLIEDTSPFINLPLGILPHQDPTTNPLLVI